MSTHGSAAIPMELVPQLLDALSASFKNLGKTMAHDGGNELPKAEDCRQPATYCQPSGERGLAVRQGEPDILISDELGCRWAAFLRFHYPMQSADKIIARDFHCAQRTARSWLAGQEPRSEVIARAGELFGLAAAVRVLFPDFQEVTTLSLVDRIDAMMTQLSALRQGFVEEPCGQPLHGGRHS